MKYAFEDSYDDALTNLFRAGYRDTSNFIYSSGKDRLLSTILREIPDKSEEIFIFIDLVFDNPSTVNTYNLLKSSLRRAGYTKFIIFPLVNTEYYIIKSLNKSNVIAQSPIVDVCVSRGNYREASIHDTYLSESKNFEKFCKRILHRYAIDCAKNTRYNNNLRYRDYYDKDCLCGEEGSECIALAQIEKVKRLLRQYPCIPIHSIVSFGKILSWDEMKVIHRELIDQYNADVRTHKKLETDTARKSKYIEATYMTF